MIDVQKIVKRAETLNTDKSDWNSFFKELAMFCLSRKAHMNSIQFKGNRVRFNNLYDSTAIRSLKIMAAGFHSNLTNPSSKWFNLRTRDLSYMDIREVQMWFNDVEDIIFATLNSSNFDTTMQEFYINSGCFGTGTVLTLEDAIDKVRFTEIPIEQVAMEEDAYGRVNRVYRTFLLSAQQAFDLWGDEAGEAVTTRLKDKPTETLKFLHYVGPRDKRVAGKSDNLNMPFESVWIEISKKHQIKESGFSNFPYAVGRFYKDINDVFGYSPAMDVLADIKLVNAQTKTMLRAAMKQADPPYILPDKGFILPLNFNPGATNYRKKDTNKDDIQNLPVSGNIPVTLEVIQSVQTSIEKSFFVPLFQALSNVTKQMTIPEVQRRISENMVLLGPTIGRFTQEVLDPILLRVFWVLYENGDLPVVPQAIAGSELDIVYISPLARAQRESEVYSIESFLSDVSAIAQVKPNALDKINEDKTVDIIAQIKGIDPEIIRSDREVTDIRKQRAEAAAQERELAMAGQEADAIQKGARAVKDMKGDKK